MHKNAPILDLSALCNVIYYQCKVMKYFHYKQSLWKMQIRVIILSFYGDNYRIQQKNVIK